MRYKAYLLIFVITTMICLPAGAKSTTPSFAQLYWAAQAEVDHKNYTEAQKLYNLAVKEAEKFPPKDTRLTTALEDLAICLEDSGSLKAALPVWERLIASYEKQFGLNYPRTADALFHAAVLSRSLGNIEQAEAFYKRALEAYQKLNDQKRQAQVLGDLGQLYLISGNFAQAETYSRKALATFPNNAGTDRQRFNTKNELCRALESQGKEAEARKLLGIR